MIKNIRTLDNVKIRLDSTRYGVDIFRNGKYETTLQDDAEGRSESFWINEGMKYIDGEPTICG
jgi:hypothetical protein